MANHNDTEEQFIKETLKGNEENFHESMKKQPKNITKNEDILIWLININKLYLQFDIPSSM